MTPHEHRMIQALAGCTFLPGSFEKRWVRNAATWAPERELTDKGRALLLKTAHRYRRQIGACLVPECAECVRLKR